MATKSPLSSVEYSTCFSVSIHKGYINKILLQLRHIQSIWIHKNRSKGEKLHVCYHIILHKSCTVPKGKHTWATDPSAIIYYYTTAAFFLSSPDIQLLDISQVLWCSSSSFGRIFAEHLACWREWKNILSQGFFW